MAAVSRSSCWLIASTLILISGEGVRYSPVPIRYVAGCDCVSMHIFSELIVFFSSIPPLSYPLVSKNTPAPHNVSTANRSGYWNVGGLRTRTQKWEWSVKWGPMLLSSPWDAAVGFTLYHHWSSHTHYTITHWSPNATLNQVNWHIKK